MRVVKDSLEEVFVGFSCFVLLVFCDCLCLEEVMVRLPGFSEKGSFPF